jgi:hypothetical protein
LEFAASGAASQHGLIENIHAHARTCITSAYAELPQEVSLASLLVEVSAARNDMSRHGTVSPNMLAFGMERRDIPHFGGGLGSDDDRLVRSNLLHDDAFRQMMEVRTKARTAYIEAEAKVRLERAENHKSRGTHGPFQAGERVMVFRKIPLGRRRAPRGLINPKNGYWYGPAVVIATEPSDPEQLRPRLYYIALFGRLYKCAEHQLRAMSPSAELARRRLLEFAKNKGVVVGNGDVDALKPDQKIKGLDITGEAPTPEDVEEKEEDEEVHEEPQDLVDFEEHPDLPQNASEVPPPPPDEIIARAPSKTREQTPSP